MTDPRAQVLQVLSMGPRTASALREALEIPLKDWRRFRQSTLKAMVEEGVISTVGYKKGVEYALSEDRVRALATTAARKAERATQLATVRAKVRAKVTTVQAKERKIAELAKELEQSKAALAAARSDLAMFIGPGHTPPPGVPTHSWAVARPSIQGAFWQDGPWKCLRLEERTVGHHRESAFIRADTGRPALRFHPDTEKWMKWVAGIASELGLAPTERQVRVVVFPGLAYTFIAWTEVDARPVADLHPMDPDNAVKPILDALQSVMAGEDRRTGAYRNDTQVVDLLVYRLPSDQRAPIDRLALSRELKATRKKREKRPRPTRRTQPRKVTRFKVNFRDYISRKGGQGEE